MDAAKSEKGLKEYLSKQITNKDLEQYRYLITKRTLEEVEAEFNVTMKEGVLGIPFASIIPDNPQTSPFHLKLFFSIYFNNSVKSHP